MTHLHTKGICRLLLSIKIGGFTKLLKINKKSHSQKKVLRVFGEFLLLLTILRRDDIYMPFTVYGMLKFEHHFSTAIK